MDLLQSSAVDDIADWTKVIASHRNKAVHNRISTHSADAVVLFWFISAYREQTVIKYDSENSLVLLKTLQVWSHCCSNVSSSVSGITITSRFTTGGNSDAIGCEACEA